MYGAQLLLPLHSLTPMVHVDAFVWVEVVPAGHGVHRRSVVAVPSADTYVPGKHVVHAKHSVAPAGA